MGMKPEQIKAMQLQMLTMQQTMSATPEAGVEAQPAARQSGRSAAAPGLSETATKEGHFVLARLPWSPGSDAMQTGSEARFGSAMHELASEIKGGSRRYKVEARVEEQGKKAQNRKLSHLRATAVIAALVAEGVPAGRLAIAEGGSDKNPRIIVQESK
jgi:hypothetical protein